MLGKFYINIKIILFINSITNITMILHNNFYLLDKVIKQFTESFKKIKKDIKENIESLLFLISLRNLVKSFLLIAVEMLLLLLTPLVRCVSHSAL